MQKEGANDGQWGCWNGGRGAPAQSDPSAAKGKDVEEGDEGIYDEREKQVTLVGKGPSSNHLPSHSHIKPAYFSNFLIFSPMPTSAFLSPLCP